MANATLDFNRLFSEIRESAVDCDSITAMQIAAQKIEAAFGVRLYFAEQMGKRVSYVAGVAKEKPHDMPEPIAISERMRVVSDNLSELSAPQRKKLIEFLRNFIGQPEDGGEWTKKR
jgi:hypothetical protein